MPYILQDLERVDFSPYKHTDVNITGFRIVDTSKPKAMEYLKEWKYLTDGKGNFGKGRNHPLFVSISIIKCGTKENIMLNTLRFHNSITSSF